MAGEVLSVHEPELGLPTEVLNWYLEHARTTWVGILKMVYPETGLPADVFQYAHEAEQATHEGVRSDKTSPTDVGFLFGSICAAEALHFLQRADAVSMIGKILSTLEKLLMDPAVFAHTREDKGLFVNWIQPSTASVLKTWPETDLPVKQQLSTVDNAWLIAFSKLASAQFPELSDRIAAFLSKIDLLYMRDTTTGFFHGCQELGVGFEPWKYDVLSEARMAYLVGDEQCIAQLGQMFASRSDQSVFEVSGTRGRKTWDGQYFQLGWPSLLVPEATLHPQWRDTHNATIAVQREYAAKRNCKYYGYTASLSPDGRYYEFRVPDAGESTDPYTDSTVINVSAIVNMGMYQPVESFHVLEQLQLQYPSISHRENGFGDTVDVAAGTVQRDQVFPNQGTSLIAAWSIVSDGVPQKLFMTTVPPSARTVYENNPLW